MSLNSHALPANAVRARKIKHLYFHPAYPMPSEEYVACLYVEAKIDYADVRSGCHVTSGLNSILDMVPLDGDLILTRDMVRPIDPAAIQSTKPENARLRKLPEFVTEDYLSRIESHYLSYLLRHAEMRLFRNFVLNAYSQPGETRSEFQGRCLEVFNETFRGDMDAMREVVNRRMERIEQKCLGQDNEGEFESDRWLAQARSKMHAVAEKIAELFLQTELTLDESALAPQYPDPRRPDLDESLETLKMDVRMEIGRLVNSYQDKVRNIDEYIIHPNLRDLHLVRTCILWMPAEVLEP
jgi:hypothetical protein